MRRGFEGSNLLLKELISRKFRAADGWEERVLENRKGRCDQFETVKVFAGRVPKVPGGTVVLEFAPVSDSAPPCWRRGFATPDSL